MPSAVISGIPYFCPGQSTLLTAPVADSYLWSDGASTPSINVISATVVSVTIFDSNGCSSTSANYSVTQAAFPPIPVITAVGLGSFCAGGSVNLFSSNAQSYLWSTGSNSQMITVNLEGLYSVNTYNAQGCTSSNAISVQFQPSGCTSIGACNYVPTAGCDDGSCVFPGCTNPTAANYDINAGCDDGSCLPSFGSLLMIAEDTVHYGDTLEVIFIINGNNVFSTNISLDFDPTKLQYVSGTVGTYFTGPTLSLPPVNNGNSIDFGVTLFGATNGITGNAEFYRLRFKAIALSPSGPVLTNLHLATIDAYNGLGEHGSFYSVTDALVTIDYMADVWPGDLNHDHICTVLDILPIGYFYNNTGPQRPDATILWNAQVAPLWGSNQSSQSSSYYKVFADSNGDGIINLTDQVAIGFNLNQVVPGFQISENEVIIGEEPRSASPILSATSTPSFIDITSPPNSVSLSIDVATDFSNYQDLYGIAFDIIPLGDWTDPSAALVNFNATTMGIVYENLLVISQNFSDRISVALTRTSPLQEGGDFHLCNITLPFNYVEGLECYNFQLVLVSANSPDGSLVTFNNQSSDACINTPVEELSYDSVVLFPNPVDAELNIKAKNNNLSKYEIVDLYGRVLSYGKLTGNFERISTSDLAAGKYFFKWYDRADQQTHYIGFEKIK